MLFVHCTATVAERRGRLLVAEVWQFLMVVLGFFIVALFWLVVQIGP